MPPDLLDDVLVKVTRVAQQPTNYVERVLQTAEDIGGDRDLRPLAELGSPGLRLKVDLLDPVMMGSG